MSPTLVTKVVPCFPYNWSTIAHVHALIFAVKLNEKNANRIQSVNSKLFPIWMGANFSSSGEDANDGD